MKHIFTFLFFLVFITSFGQNQEFEQSVDAIKNELKTVENSKKKFEQSIEVMEPGVVNLSIAEVDSKGKTTTNEYIINLGDLDDNTLRHFTNKDIIQVQLIIEKNQKLIKHISNGDKISYINKVIVQTKNIDNARLLVELFNKAIPFSKQITEKRLSLNSYNDHINWIIKNIEDVSLSKSSISQIVTILENKVGNFDLARVYNEGSKSKSEAFQFNLATLNENSVVFKISGETFSVETQSKRKLKTIKNFKDHEQQNYRDNISIFCNSVENARDLQKVLKNAIVLAREKFEKTIPVVSNFNDGIEKLNKLINTVTVGTETTNQSFSNKTITEFIKKESTEKSTKESVYNFNFTDLNKNSIDYFIKSKEIFVEIATQSSKKYIKLVEDNELQNYIHKTTLIFSSVDDAIFAKEIIIQLIKIATDNTKPLVYSSFNGSFKSLTNNVINVDVEDNKSFEQVLELGEINDNNLLKFTSTYSTEKSSKESIYEFNLSDLNNENINLETKGKKVFVKLNTNYGEKIIKVYLDGEIKNYQNNLIIHADNVESARSIRDLFKLLVENKK